MIRHSSSHRTSSARPPCNRAAGSDASDEVLVRLDLLRGDLYRLLDELVRAGTERRPALLEELESLWERFKLETRRRQPSWPGPGSRSRG